MGKAALVFLFIIAELAAAAAFINKLPVGNVGGADNHVASKHNLARHGRKGCVIGGAEGKSNALQHLVISAMVFGNDQMDALTNGVGSGVLDGGRLG
eukprot:9986682-Ditylum_brightwellii.AAC.1